MSEGRVLCRLARAGDNVWRVEAQHDEDGELEEVGSVSVVEEQTFVRGGDGRPYQAFVGGGHGLVERVLAVGRFPTPELAALEVARRALGGVQPQVRAPSGPVG